MDQTAIRMQRQGKQGEGEVMLPLQAVRGRGLRRGGIERQPRAGES